MFEAPPAPDQTILCGRIIVAARPLPDVAYLRECLDYDPETGEFRWKTRPLGHFVSARGHWQWNPKFAGKIAGSLDRLGYRLIGIDGVLFRAHRLAWLLVHGEPVPVEIDHYDRNPDNNSADNLRAATRSENMANTVLRRDSTVGAKGVQRQPNGRFQAVIRHRNMRFCLGTFDTIEEAAEARRKAARHLNGEFARYD